MAWDLQTVSMIGMYFLTGGALGALVGALLQRRIDRELLAAEWKQGLRTRILSPRLDTARELYTALTLGDVPTDAEREKLPLNQAEIILTELPRSTIEATEALIKSFSRYETFRDSVRQLCDEIFGGEKSMDGHFRHEGFRTREYYEGEVDVAGEHSQEGRDARQIEAIIPGCVYRERFQKLKREFVIAQEIKYEITTNLLKLMMDLKGLILKM